jgi:hypothetical protein
MSLRVWKAGIGRHSRNSSRDCDNTYPRTRPLDPVYHGVEFSESVVMSDKVKG